MRGDRPTVYICYLRGRSFTPHARGSTLLLGARLLHQLVYPACAGIDLKTVCEGFACSGLPRMRGDRPRYWIEHTFVCQFTPHARGSTLRSSFGRLKM